MFLVTHPLALTGVYASGPLTDAMPDPREAFRDDLETPAESSEGEDPRMLGAQERPALGITICLNILKRAFVWHFKVEEV